MRRQFDVLQFGQADELAGRHDLGEHHGHGLEVVDLLLPIDPGGPVLHDQGPDRPAPAQERHAEEGVERVLPRLGPVGEARVQGGVGQVQGPSEPKDLADQALPRPKAGDVYGLGVQALGGEQLELARGATEVDRAHLRHHGVGDDADDLVQAALSRAAARHHLADLAQQTAWSAHRQHPLHHATRLL